MYAEDPETGALIGNDVLRRAFHDAGFENILMDASAAFPNMKNIPPGTIHVITSNPANIRSHFAKFDPAKKDSADLLASTAGATALSPAAVEYLRDSYDTVPDQATEVPQFADGGSVAERIAKAQRAENADQMTHRTSHSAMPDPDPWTWGDTAEFLEPFSVGRYREAVSNAKEGNYPAMILNSAATIPAVAVDLATVGAAAPIVKGATKMTGALAKMASKAAPAAIVASPSDAEAAKLHWISSMPGKDLVDKFLSRFAPDHRNNKAVQDAFRFADSEVPEKAGRTLMVTTDDGTPIGVYGFENADNGGYKLRHSWSHQFGSEVPDAIVARYLAGKPYDMNRTRGR
jgi:hypothetical protein